MAREVRDGALYVDAEPRDVMIHSLAHFLLQLGTIVQILTEAVAEVAAVIDSVLLLVASLGLGEVVVAACGVHSGYLVKDPYVLGLLASRSAAPSALFRSWTP